MPEKLDSLITRLETFLSDYCAFTEPSQALVVALWCVGTWLYRRFDAYPYLCITAATKQAGKTRLAELMAFVCCNPKQSTAMTPAVMFRLLDQFSTDENPQAGVTIFYDEAEVLGHEAQNALTQVLNSGYRRGQTIMRTVKDVIVEYSIYCPKVFIQIGDVRDTLRDRSITINLRRGVPRRLFDWTTAEAEGFTIVTELRKAIADWIPSSDPVVGLTGRERELWAPLFAIARKARVDHRLVRAAADFAALKTAPKRKADRVAESRMLDNEYAIRALRDLASIFGVSERMLKEDAVVLMRGIDAAPWRTFGGLGLDARTLSRLVGRFDLRVRNIKTAGTNTVRKGYYRKDVLAALDTIGTEEKESV